jgi:hypothetical protein
LGFFGEATGVFALSEV